MTAQALLLPRCSKIETSRCASGVARVAPACHQDYFCSSLRCAFPFMDYVQLYCIKAGVYYYLDNFCGLPLGNYFGCLKKSAMHWMRHVVMMQKVISRVLHFKSLFLSKIRGRVFRSSFFTTNSKFFGVFFCGARNSEFFAFLALLGFEFHKRFMFEYRNKKTQSLQKRFYSMGALASCPLQGDTKGYLNHNPCYIRK